MLNKALQREWGQVEGEKTEGREEGRAAQEK